MMRPDAPESVRRLLESHGRILDPIERFGEIIFGLVMVLTFTGALSVATSGRPEVKEMLVGAIGCNIAWGIVDGVMYVVASLVERARRSAILRVLQETADPAFARTVLGIVLPDGVLSVMDDAVVDRLLRRARELPPPPARASVGAADLRGALAVFLLVVGATLPVALPFVLIKDVRLALRVSNAIAIGMLFLAGLSLGRATGGRPVRLGMGMVVLGATLAALTLALGG